MLSSMSYTPPEVFAYNLNSKLNSLRSTSSQNDRESQSMPRDLPALASKKLQLILENHDLELGTTFPPRTRSIKNRSNQFHSETNLNRLEDDNEAHSPDEITTHIEVVERSNSDTGNLNKWLGQISKDDTLEDMNQITEIWGGNCPPCPPGSADPELEKFELKGDDKQQDCDLFFDFDINLSPTQDETLDDTNGDQFESEVSPTDFRNRIGSESSLEMTGTGNSTAFGSTSSGLYSDQEILSNKDSEKGFCIAPEDWQKFNFVDMLEMAKNGEIEQKMVASSPTQQKTSSQEVSTPQALSPSQETSQDESTLRGTTVSDVSSDETVDGNEFENTSTVSKRSTNSSSSESNTSIISTKRSASSSVEKKSPSSGKKVPNSGKKSPPSAAKNLAKSPPTNILLEVSNKTTSIHIGETEKKIATSKLTSLISSLLDKDEDRPHSFHGKKSSISPEKSTSGSKSSVTSVSAAGSNSFTEKSDKIVKNTKIQEIPAFGTSMGTSPANFSFLSDLMKEKENNENVGGKTLPDKFEIDPLIRERSHSASKLNDIKKIHKRMVSEGSSENSPLVSQNATSSSSDTGSEKVITETEEDDDDSNKAKYRRCSSLRSGKTPPGTPGRRKIVRFADVLGLDLDEVKTFLDEIPKVPKSAYNDLKDAELSDLESSASDSGSEPVASRFQVHAPTKAPTAIGASSTSPRMPKPNPTFSPLFAQPSGNSDFFTLLRDQKVKLESAWMSTFDTVKGTVRVVNLDFHKAVSVKYTVDDWATSSDTQGFYLKGSCDGFSDKFSFNLDISAIKGQIGKKVQFCLCFCCGQNQYWDNNNGRNYSFQCFGATQVQKSVPMPNRTQNSYNQIPSKPPGNFGIAASPSMISDPWQKFH